MNFSFFICDEIIDENAHLWDITKDAKDLITLKCSSCGAEVTIDAASSVQARCHWCRNYLSINEQIPNGIVPDMILPFKVSKEDAKEEIEKLAKKRNLYIKSGFKKEFNIDNIMGVYLPYMVIDINQHIALFGEGRQIKNNTKEVYYISREFDMEIDDLTAESNLDFFYNNSNIKFNSNNPFGMSKLYVPYSSPLNNTIQANNIINSIMPFDTENCVKWDANFIKGYTLEKRDINTEILEPFIEKQAENIALIAANKSCENYDGSIKWLRGECQIKGKRWKTAYLPVWLYSYEDSDEGLQYIAVNGRTKETMGSIPFSKEKFQARILIPAVILFAGIIILGMNTHPARGSGLDMLLAVLFIIIFVTIWTLLFLSGNRFTK